MTANTVIADYIYVYLQSHDIRNFQIGWIFLKNCLFSASWHQLHLQITRSSAVAERPRTASCHWIFRYVTQRHSRSFVMTFLRMAMSLFVFRCHYVRILYLVPFLRYAALKWRDLGIWVCGRPRSLKMAPGDSTVQWVQILLRCNIVCTARGLLCTCLLLFSLLKWSNWVYSSTADITTNYLLFIPQ